MRILEGAASLPTWDAETLLGVVAELREIGPDLRVAWDLEAGEEWCSIGSREGLVAAFRAPMIHVRATRFAFIHAGSALTDEIRAVAESADALVIETDDFEAEVFSIDAADLAEFKANEMVLSEEWFDPSRFAANDLIFFPT